MKAPSLSAVRETLRETAPGITIRKEDCGEYRVTFTQEAIAAAFPAMTRAERIEKAEALASYDSDICAAYETGKAMFRTGLNPATVEPEAAPVRTIDMTPTWAAILPALLAAVTDGTPTGQAIARKELARMASIADSYVALVKGLPAISPRRAHGVADYLESDSDFTANNLEAAVLLLERLAA